MLGGRSACRDFVAKKSRTCTIRLEGWSVEREMACLMPILSKNGPIHAEFQRILGNMPKNSKSNYFHARREGASEKDERCWEYRSSFEYRDQKAKPLPAIFSYDILMPSMNF